MHLKTNGSSDPTGVFVRADLKFTGKKPAKSGIRKGKKRADDVPVDGDVVRNPHHMRYTCLVHLWSRVR